MPILTGENLYSPSEPVVVLSEALVPWLVRVTETPLTVPPEASVTVPEMLPASTCARRGAELHSNTTRLASPHTETRPNNAERAFPFIAFPSRALAGPSTTNPDSVV